MPYFVPLSGPKRGRSELEGKLRSSPSERKGRISWQPKLQSNGAALQPLNAGPIVRSRSWKLGK